MALLSSKAVGSIVKLKVNGTARNFIVVHQGLPGSMYDTSCNGTWLLMEDIYAQMTWDSSNNDYENSNIHSYLNNTFVNLFDSDIRSVIKQVKLPYTQGTGNGGSLKTGSSGISTKVFLLSYAEVMDRTYTYVNTEGAALGYFNGAADSKRVAKLNGSVTNWWFRSPSTFGTIGVWLVNASGIADDAAVDLPRGVRPAMILPGTLSVDDSGNIIANTPPTTPGIPTLPDEVIAGESCSVSWTASSDAESSVGYKLEVSVDGGNWTQIYDGTNRSYSYSVSSGTSTVAFRVKAYDSEGLESAYATSGTAAVVTRTPIGDVPVGGSVFMNVGGVRTEFLVVHQGLPGTMYDSSCDGTWLLMKDIYTSRAFDSSNHDYENSDIHSYLNNAFVNLFDSDIKSTIKQVKVPYRKGSGSSTSVASGSIGLSTKVFLLSCTEVGFSGDSDVPVEGAVLNYFNDAAGSKRVAKLDGSATDWWLRTPYTENTADAWFVTFNGYDLSDVVFYPLGVRPALVLPSNIKVDGDFDVISETTPNTPLDTPIDIDDNTLLLIHGDSITDSSPYKRQLVNLGAISTTCTGSLNERVLYFNGSSKINLPIGDYFNFGAGDFTVEWREYSTTTYSVSGNPFTFDKDPAHFLFYYTGSTIGLFYTTTYGNTAVAQISVGEWVHRAFVRSGSTLYFFQNGQLIWSGAITLNTPYTEGYQMCVGGRSDYDQYFIGYMEEFRVSNVARWTSDFTPPDKPYKAEKDPSTVLIWGSYNKLSDILVNVNGAWKNYSVGYANVNGVWKEFMSASGLPSGYAKLEYIESTGTQYINTGFNPNQDTRVIMDAQLNDYTDVSPLSAYFGAADGSTYFRLMDPSTGNNNLVVYYNTVYSNRWDVPIGIRRIIDMNGSVTTIDNVTKSYSEGTFQLAVPLFLFASSTKTGSANYLSKGKLYSCQIYDAGVLIRDFVPCLNESGVAGLWDKVEGKFYGNAGTGEFVYSGYAPKTLNDYSWAEIKAISDAGQAANYFSVGDRKAVTLNGKVSDGLTFSNETYYCYIIGIDHNSSREGSNLIHFQFGYTALSGGTHIAFVDGGYGDYKTSGSWFNMRTSDSNSGGWSASNMRKNIMPAFQSAMPSELQSVLKTVTKYSDNMGEGSNTVTNVRATTDTFFLLSEWELFGSRTYANSYEYNYQAQYSYYSAGNSKVRYRHSSTGSEAMWSLRSVYADSTNTFCVMHLNGRENFLNATCSLGVAPAFCV